MAHHAEDISKIEDIGERLDALLDALEESSQEVARASASLDEDAPPPPRPKQPALEPQAVAKTEPAPVQATDEPEQQVVEEPQATEPEAHAAQPEELSEQLAEQQDEAEPVLDDGLLIEPEQQAPEPASDDIDGAPVASADLERELDEELESLLASGVFEDPVGEMGIDESADPVELPDDETDAAAEAELLAPSTPPERTSNLPTDEAELIGELDEQLAALADAQLEADEPAPEPEPTLPSPAPEPQIEAQPIEAAASEPAPASTPEPTPQPETKPEPPAATPAAAVVPVVDKPKWRAAAERALVVAKPVVVRAASRTGTAMVAGARRASTPLDGKPQLKQIVGWVALVQAFLATCVWVYLALWHNPPQPQTAPQPTLEQPTDG